MFILKLSNTSTGIQLISKVVLEDCGLNNSSIDTIHQWAAESPYLFQESKAAGWC